MEPQSRFRKFLIPTLWIICCSIILVFTVLAYIGRVSLVHSSNTTTSNDLLRLTSEFADIVHVLYNESKKHGLHT
jgi:hypothetical protein